MVTCKDVNRECEYGDIKTKTDEYDETERVVLRTFGYDEIAENRPTGRRLARITEYQVCKFCGDIKELSVKTKRVVQSKVYEDL